MKKTIFGIIILSVFLLTFFIGGSIKGAVWGLYYDSTLTGGLAAYWTFNGEDTNWATQITNDTALTNHARLNGFSTTTSPIAGIEGQGLDFDGIDDIGEFGNSSSVQLTTWTISAWIKPRSQKVACIVCKMAATGDPQADNYVFYTDSSGQLHGDFEDTNGTSYSSATTDAPITINEWQFVVFLFDNATNVSELWHNGSLKVSSTTALTPETADASGGSFGAENDSNPGIINSVFNGLMDEVRMYNRALSNEEITHLYQTSSYVHASKIAVSPRTKLTKGLVAYYTNDGMDTNWGTGKAIDQSGQGNNLNLILLSTTTAPIAGIEGQGLQFSGPQTGGSQQLVAANVTSGIPNNSDFSMSVWIYPYRTDNPDIVFNVGLDALVSAAHFIFRSSDRICFDAYGLTAVTCFTGASTLRNRWSHLAGVYTESNTTMRLYLNGSSITTSSNNVNLTPGQINFGGWQSQSIWFRGIIDEARIYNRALSASDVKELYEMSLPNQLK